MKNVIEFNRIDEILKTCNIEEMEIERNSDTNAYELKYYESSKSNWLPMDDSLLPDGCLTEL